MRFLFVNHIDKMSENGISGRVFFPVDEPMQHNHVGREPHVASGAVSEALGQLASWLCIKRNDFTARPVFLFADNIQNYRHIAPDTEVSMDCQVDAMDDRTFTFSGVAHVGGEKIAAIENCNGYFMPLEQLEDPEVTRSRFAALTSGGLQLSGRGGSPFPFARLIDDIIELEDNQTITAMKRFDSDYPFYADHFPRFPVTPIVMLNEMIGVSAKRLLGVREEQSIIAREVSGIKIKNFVKPDETCTVKVKVMQDVTPEDQPATRLVTTVAEIHKDEKRILRGRYVYEIRG